MPARRWTAADFCVAVELECVKDSGRLPIDHGGQLPELPEFSVVLYGADKAGNDIAETLIEYLQRAYT